MKVATTIGILLILFGIVGFVAGGIHYTHRKQDAKIGPMHISHQQHKTIPISPVLSSIALIGGIGLVVVGARG